jgi:hypothetical protein
MPSQRDLIPPHIISRCELAAIRAHGSVPVVANSRRRVAIEQVQIFPPQPLPANRRKSVTPHMSLTYPLICPPYL